MSLSLARKITVNMYMTLDGYGEFPKYPRSNEASKEPGEGLLRRVLNLVECPYQNRLLSEVLKLPKLRNYLSLKRKKACQDMAIPQSRGVGRASRGSTSKLGWNLLSMTKLWRKATRSTTRPGR